MTKQDQPHVGVEAVKVAVAFRAGRTAIGWNQEEFAEKLGVAKSTIARIETMETAASAVVFVRALHLLKENGVVVDLLTGDAVTLQISEEALEEAARRLKDDQMRRTDRKKGKGQTVIDT